MWQHRARELHCTVGASIWVSLSAPLLTEKGKPRVTVGHKVTDRCRVRQRWPGYREVLLMRTTHDRDRADRRFLAGTVLPHNNFAQVTP